MLRPAILATIFTAGMPVWSHDPITTKITWSREVARIVYQRCLTCHNPAGPAFSLVHYQDARPWAKAIAEEVLNRRMPPWNAVKGFGHFQNDRGLTQQELTVISDWVEGGAPEGDPRDLPAIRRLPAEPPGQSTRRISIEGTLLLDQQAEAVGIVAAGPLQVIATRPDGSIEPLIWLRGSGEATYWFRSKLPLPAGTRLQTFPPARATLVLR
jgi:hypothetical protein